MHSRKKVLWVFLLALPLWLSGSSVFSQTVDDAGDDEPEVKARVARLSFISGDVQVRRSGNKDWEKAAQNLPVVEGDEISTGADARAELQLDTTSHLRLDGRSYLKFNTLKDEGIAVSVPQGSMSVRLLEFDKSKSFFEIDAPMTTVAIERSGIYRIDSGTDNDKVVRVSVTEFGEARVYTDSSGFTLRNGRSARINIEGQYAGEYETADASRFADDFDIWSLGRDAAIAKRLKDAYYDKYYDRDIYGAEDLNDNGEWIHTRAYGYVWRPYSSAIQNYPDWSPYRYGNWRWVPPYGWTWVNDEPWGWATYHHGRWVYDNGYWVWTPYGYHRGRRSWWWPALVVFHSIRDSFCWYPMPYTYVSFNFNYHGGRRRDRDRRDWRDGDRRDDRGGNWNGRGNPTPSPSPVTGADRMKRMPFYNVPVGGVVAVNASDFGSGRRGFKTPPADVAKIVLSKDPDDANSIPRLPKFEEVVSGGGKELRPETAPTKPVDNLRIGAIERKNHGPVDDELRNTRIRGGRQPVQKEAENSPTVDQMQRGGARLRQTGAVERPVQPQVEAPEQPVKTIPRFERKPEETKPAEPSVEQPRRGVMPRIERPKADDQPRNEPPRKSIPSRIETPRSEEPKREQPKYEPPPQREPPRSEPPAKGDDPPPKQEQPKQREDKPQPVKPTIIERKKDGRK